MTAVEEQANAMTSRFAWRGRPDDVREYWLNDERLNATEVLTTPRTAAIVATHVA